MLGKVRHRINTVGTCTDNINLRHISFQTIGKIQRDEIIKQRQMCGQIDVEDKFVGTKETDINGR